MSDPTPAWLLWQVLDSGFPTGGFAHSGGLEAAAHQGELRGPLALAQFAQASLLQAGRGALPLVAAVAREPERFEELDALCDAMLVNEVANRASRAQGHAHLIAVEAAFPTSLAAGWRQRVRKNRLPGHYACAFGATAPGLNLDAAAAAHAFLFITLRSLMSSAVRLNIVGPMEAQALQARLAPEAASIAQRHATAGLDTLAHVAPVLDILHGGHDRLYTRLFQS